MEKAIYKIHGIRGNRIMDPLILEEVRRIENKKSHNKRISIFLWVFLSVIISMIGFQSVGFISKGEGITWKCQCCGYRNWAESPDFWGKVYCGHCKQPKS